MNPQGNQQQGGYYPYQPNNPQMTVPFPPFPVNGGGGTYPIQQFPIPAGAPVLHYGYSMPIPQTGSMNTGMPPGTSSSSGNNGRNATSTFSPDPSKDWNPSQKDMAQLDKWFFEIDKGGSGFIGGSQAVEFLKHSNLSRDTLRAIWSLVDSNNAGRIDLYQVSIRSFHLRLMICIVIIIIIIIIIIIFITIPLSFIYAVVMDSLQFYKVIRLVAIACSPIYMGSQPNIDRYYATAKNDIPLPAMILTGISTSLLDILFASYYCYPF